MRMKRVGRNVATLVTVLLLVFMVGCVPVPAGVTPPPAPEEVTPSPTAEPIPTPMPEANFRLLISDEVNAIGDFDSLKVTISSVGVHRAGEDGDWIEPLDIIEEELNLVDLQELRAEEIWSDTLPDGDYNKVFVNVSEIDAELNNGDSTEVKLPSDKLHINTHFSILDDSPVSFVFDISVVAAGTEQSGINYILKPVVGQSGPNQNFIDVSSLGEDEDEEIEDEDEDEEIEDEDEDEEIKDEDEDEEIEDEDEDEEIEDEDEDEEIEDED